LSNHSCTQMNADKKPLYESESREIVGSAMEVLNELGHGLHEKPYENALVVEFGLRGISCVRQQRYKVLYKGEEVGEYIPDLIAFEEIVIDTKVIEKITDHEIGQMINYLRITDLRLGYLLNFKRAKLEWKRIVL